MKICIVSCEYPPFRGGGIGTYADNMSRFLAEAGHEVHVVCNRWIDFGMPPEQQPSALQHSGNLWIHRVDGINSKYEPRPPHDDLADPLGTVCRNWDSSLYYSALVADELERVCREHQIEVIEFPECYAEAYIMLRRRNLGEAALDVPVTITLHSPIQEITEYNLYRKYEAWYQRRTTMEDYCILNADMLSCPSTPLVGMVRRRLNIDPDRYPCEVIYNPMDFASLDHPTAVVEEDPYAPPSLLFVGRIEPRKGVRYLVDAVVRLLPKYPDLKLHLIGRDCDAGDAPGTMIEHMWRRIPQHLGHAFHFEGLKPRAEVLQRYATATACVFPAPWDNLPYTVCEAMAYGACVIGSDNGGFTEMIEDGQSGLLFRAGDVGSLCSAIERALNDAELRRKLRYNAGPRIRTVCDPATAVKRREVHYQTTVERHRALRGHRQYSIPKTPPGKVALLLPNHTSQEAMAKTIDSVRTSAARAGLSVDVSVIGTSVHQLLTEAPPGVHLANSGLYDDSTAIELWCRRLETIRPDYLLQMWPGEVLYDRYFEETLRVLRRGTKVAWCTTWAKSNHTGPQEPYAGFDFKVPLELMYHHPVPFAVLRYDAFCEAGGWNYDLPAGWRQWDLWINLEQAGWQGIVIPHWLAEFVPYNGTKTDPPWFQKSHELALERLVARNRKLLGEHAVEMWIGETVARNVLAHRYYAALQNGDALAAARRTLANRMKKLAQRLTKMST